MSGPPSARPGGRENSAQQPSSQADIPPSLHHPAVFPTIQRRSRFDDSNGQSDASRSSSEGGASESVSLTASERRRAERRRRRRRVWRERWVQRGRQPDQRLAQLFGRAWCHQQQGGLSGGLRVMTVQSGGYCERSGVVWCGLAVCDQLQFVSWRPPTLHDSICCSEGQSPNAARGRPQSSARVAIPEIATFLNLRTTLTSAIVLAGAWTVCRQRRTMEVEVVSLALQVRNRLHGMILRLCDTCTHCCNCHSPQQDGLRPVHNYGWCGVARLPVRRALPAGPVPTVGVSQSPSARRRHIHCSRYPLPARDHQHRSCGRTATEILSPLCTAGPAAALIHLPYASKDVQAQQDRLDEFSRRAQQERAAVATAACSTRSATCGSCTVRHRAAHRCRHCVAPPTV